MPDAAEILYYMFVESMNAAGMLEAGSTTKNYPYISAQEKQALDATAQKLMSQGWMPKGD